MLEIVPSDQITLTFDHSVVSRRDSVDYTILPAFDNTMPCSNDSLTGPTPPDLRDRTASLITFAAAVPRREVDELLKHLDARRLQHRRQQLGMTAGAFELCEIARAAGALVCENRKRTICG